MARWNKLAALAANQFGLVAVWQAARLGIGRDVLARHARECGWHRVAHGVCLLPGCGLTPTARLKAVELALRSPLAFSHDSAAFLWGLVPNLGDTVHVVSGLDHKRTAAGVDAHRMRAFDRMAVTTRSSLPVLAPAETLCTFAAISSVDRLVKVMAKADRMRLVTPRQTAVVAAELGKFNGRATVREALARIDHEGLPHSDLERIARALLRTAGLTPHGRPYTVLDRRGRLLAEVDIAFIEQRVAVAIDGPHHGEAGQRRLDEDQRQELEALGWIVLRADEFRLVQEPHRFIRQVKEALERQAA
jgi:hypothetical protein